MPSLPSGHPILPLDIFELIIAELARGEAHLFTVKAFCLASKHFVPMCRKHIFHKLAVHPHSSSGKDSEDRPADWFKRTLGHDPFVAKCVRELSLMNDHHDMLPRGIEMLKQLRRVKIFTLDFLDRNGLDLSGQANWLTLPVTFKSSLSHFVQVNAIVRLHLYNIHNFPIALLRQFGRLEFVFVDNVQVAEESVPNLPSKTTTAPRLRELRVELGCLRMMQIILSPERVRQAPIWDLSRLESFSIYMEEVDTAKVLNRVLNLSGSMKSVACSCAEPNLDCFKDMASNLTRESLQTLRKVKIRPLLESADVDPFGNFTKELEQIAGRNVLEEISILVEVDTDTRCTTDPGRWAQLNSVLSAGGFTGLRRVDIKVIVWHIVPLDELFFGELERIGEEQFKGIRENKNLDLSFVLQDEWV